MPVVVTGAAGFLGRVLVRTLVDRGHRVVAIDRRTSVLASAGAGALPVVADLLDDDPRVRDALRGAHAVWHLAGAPGVRDERPDADLRRHRDNVLAARAVLAVTPAAVPVVVTSSSSVYGGAVRGPSREGDPLRPAGGYARSKVAVERACAQRAAAGGAVVVARPFTLVGEGQRADMALHRWLVAGRAGRPVSVLGGLERTRDFTDVRVAARALVDLASVADAADVVNVGSGRPRTLAELLAAVARAVGCAPEVRVLPADREEVPATWACTRRLASLVGEPPVLDLDDVVARALAGLDAPVRVRAVG